MESVELFWLHWLVSWKLWCNTTQNFPRRMAQLISNLCGADDDGYEHQDLISFVSLVKSHSDGPNVVLKD